MTTKLAYAIRYVADMDGAVRFYTGQVGLVLRFSSPEWSEFDTGATTLALHAASAEKPAGTCEIGFGVDAVDAFYARCTAAGVVGVSPPADLHGHRIASLRDVDGAEFNVSAIADR
jgi:lactoylglutathione lyase